jgi:hypothetical protein
VTKKPAVSEGSSEHSSLFIPSVTVSFTMVHVHRGRRLIVLFIPSPKLFIMARPSRRVCRRIVVPNKCPNKPFQL